MYGIDDFMERKRRNPMGTFDRLERALNLRVSGLKDGVKFPQLEARIFSIAPDFDF